MGLAAALFSREVGLGRVMLMERHRLAWAASGGAGGALARFSLTLYRQFAQEWDDGGLLREAPGLLLFLEGPPAGLRRWPRSNCWTPPRWPIWSRSWCRCRRPWSPGTRPGYIPCAWPPPWPAGQALAAWISTGRPPRPVRNFHLSRFGRSS
jgi:hypothetical protein